MENLTTTPEILESITTMVSRLKAKVARLSEENQKLRQDLVKDQLTSHMSVDDKSRYGLLTENQAEIYNQMKSEHDNKIEEICLELKQFLADDDDYDYQDLESKITDLIGNLERGE